MVSLAQVIHIQNLTPEITIEDIKETYEKSGEINKIILGRTEALVFFSDEDEAESSLFYTMIGNVDVEVTNATSLTLTEVIKEASFGEQESTVAETINQSTSHNQDIEFITKSLVQEQAPQPVVEEKHVVVEEKHVVVEEKKEEIKVEEQKPHHVEPVHQEVRRVEEVFERAQEAKVVVEQKVEEILHHFELPKPVVVEQHKEVVVEQPKPVIVEEPKHVEVEQPKPVVVEQPKPVVVEQPKPVVVEQPRFVEEPKPIVHETPKTVVEEPKLVQLERPLAQVVEVKVESKPQVCPLERNSPKGCPVSAGTSFSTCTTSTATTTSSVDSVQLLKTLKNTSLPERTKPSSSDLFQNVFNQNFLAGLLGLLIAITVFTQVF